MPQRRTSLLALLFGVAPFGFGAIRALTARYDLRMLWMAAASFAGAWVVRWIFRAWGRQAGVAAVSAAVFAGATVPAALTAYQLGATAAAGVWPVAGVFGICWAMHYALGARAPSVTAG